MKKRIEPSFASGDLVAWRSQSYGVHKEKRGRVLCVVRYFESLIEHLDVADMKHLSMLYTIKGGKHSRLDRYAVSVPRFTSRKNVRVVAPKPFLYLPSVKLVDRFMAERKPVFGDPPVLGVWNLADGEWPYPGADDVGGVE